MFNHFSNGLERTLEVVRDGCTNNIDDSVTSFSQFLNLSNDRLIIFHVYK